MKFRAFCESPSYCGLELSPLIAAIADASDGLTPTTIGDAEAIAHFGCALVDLPRETRRTVAVRAGGRGGKTSRLLAPKALHAAWTVPVPTLRRGEVASAMLIAPDLGLARQALSFCAGYVEGSPILSRALTSAPTKDAIELRRPDGKRVRIEVRAAARGGRAVRGRTLVFAGLDEACFFFDEQSGVVNDADIYRAVLQRIVPGGQAWIVSTPWLADVGLLETTLAKNLGTHSNALAVTGGTRALNPTWDPTGEIERDLREQDPDAAIREIDGQPMSGGAGVFFDPAAITACVDDTLVLPVEPRAGVPYAFGADLGFVSDSSALAGVTLELESKIDVVVVEELRPAKGAPLKPREVVGSFAATIKKYGGESFCADLHHRESAREHLETAGLEFVDAPAGRDGKAEAFLHAKKLVHEGRVRLPNLPRLLSQLRQIVSRPVPGGGVVITSPRRRGGGGHGDLVSALVNALWQAHDGDGLPAWVGLVNEWQRHEAPSPPARPKPVKPEDFAYSPDGDFGRREKGAPMPALTVSAGGVGSGFSEATGNPPHFDSRMRATWFLGNDAEFNAHASDAFKAAVADFRRSTGRSDRSFGA